MRVAPRAEWSICRCDDGLMTVAPLLDRLGRVTALIHIEPETLALARLRAAETIGRPLGSDDSFLRRARDSFVVDRSDGSKNAGPLEGSRSAGVASIP
jgi:hypothetical protein